MAVVKSQGIKGEALMRAFEAGEVMSRTYQFHPENQNHHNTHWIARWVLFPSGLVVSGRAVHSLIAKGTIVLVGEEPTTYALAGGDSACSEEREANG